MHECLFRGFSWHVKPIRFPAGLLFGTTTVLVWSWLCGNLQAENLKEYIKHHPTMDIVDLSQRVANGRGRGCVASGTLSTLLTSSGRMYSRVPGPIFSVYCGSDLLLSSCFVRCSEPRQHNVV